MNKLHLILIVIISFLFISLHYLYVNYTELKDKYYISVNNIKAMDEENTLLQDRIIEYQLTTTQLVYSKDSITSILNKARNELRIKDENLKRLEYLHSTAKKTDTIIIRDTIFKDPEFFLDTSKKDQWYSLHLKLSYPNKIEVTPEFRSEKYIITHLKKETINPPKKCKIGRLFQRKHKVIEVEVIENNPYIKNNKQKFINIL